MHQRATLGVRIEDGDHHRHFAPSFTAEYFPLLLCSSGLSFPVTSMYWEEAIAPPPLLVVGGLQHPFI